MRSIIIMSRCTSAGPTAGESELQGRRLKTSAEANAASVICSGSMLLRLIFPKSDGSLAPRHFLIKNNNKKTNRISPRKIKSFPNWTVYSTFLGKAMGVIATISLSSSPLRSQLFSFFPFSSRSLRLSDHNCSARPAQDAAVI